MFLGFKPKSYTSSDKRPQISHGTIKHKMNSSKSMRQQGSIGTTHKMKSAIAMPKRSQR
jgi:hypothetical protein